MSSVVTFACATGLCVLFTISKDLAPVSLDLMLNVFPSKYQTCVFRAFGVLITILLFTRSRYLLDDNYETMWKSLLIYRPQYLANLSFSF